MTRFNDDELNRKQALALGASALVLALSPPARPGNAAPLCAPGGTGDRPRAAGGVQGRDHGRHGNRGARRARLPDAACGVAEGPSAPGQGFEVYVDEAAYLTHRETAHFRTFLATTKDMVRSRKLLDAVPIQLNAKSS